MRLYMGRTKFTSAPTPRQSARITVPNALVRSIGIEKGERFWIIYDTEKEVIEYHRKEPEQPMTHK